MGSSAGVVLFVLEHREEEEDEGGRKEKGKERKGWWETNKLSIQLPAASNTHHDNCWSCSVLRGSRPLALTCCSVLDVQGVRRSECRV